MLLSTQYAKCPATAVEITSGTTRKRDEDTPRQPEQKVCSGGRMMKDFRGQKVPHEVASRPVAGIGTNVSDDNRQDDRGPEQQQLNPVRARQVAPGALGKMVDHFRHR